MLKLILILFLLLILKLIFTKKEYFSNYWKHLENQIDEYNRIKSDNIGRLNDLTDGAIIFEFPYVSLSNYFFNSDDSKLFYYDNKFIKQIVACKKSCWQLSC